MKLLLKTDYLKAAILCASTETTRYYLKGVHITGVDNMFNVVATDGKSLFAALQQDASETDAPLSFTFTIPLDICKLAVKAVGRNPVAVIELPQANFESGRATIAGIGFDAIEAGTYPDWRRVVPEKTTGETAHFDANLVAIWAKVGKVFKSNPHFYHNGTGPAFITLGDDNAFGLLMPMRDGVFSDCAEIVERVTGKTPIINKALEAA